jgi:hypothetical protein
LLQRLDPVAQEVLAATEAWEAYEAANQAGGLLVDELTWMPHGGRVYVTWAALTDLFEIGDTSLEIAHDVLREAAARWLSKPQQADPNFLAAWLLETQAAIGRAAKGDLS